MTLHDRSQARNAFTPDASNTRLLRDAFGRFATGVTIVTTATDKGVVATTANSFSSVSLNPPLVLWCPDRNSRRFPYFEDATKYAIHVLGDDQDDLCWRVAKDAFVLDTFGLNTNAEGVPLIENCLARFECTKRALYEGGDHSIMLGQVTRAEMRDHGSALAFFKGQVGRFTQQ